MKLPIRKKYSKAVLSLAAVAALGVFTACSDEEDDDATDLEGTWAQACTKESDSSYTKTEVTFKGKDYSVTVDAFSDAACATKTFTLAASGGTFTIGDAYEAGTKIDEEASTKVTLTVATDDMVTAFNTDALCGAGFVTKGTAKELKSTDCKETFKSAFAKTYDIFKIDGTKVTFGNTDSTVDGTKLDGTSDATRPKTLETYSYTKK